MLRTLKGGVELSILGIIAEYNPLHSGHLYHLQTAKKLIRPEATIAVMSGSFTQRGEPALIDKWSRAQMALAAGIDLVVELPTAWATSSAPNFAAGATRLLAAAGATDICFGSELGQIEPLQQIASILLQEPALYRSALKSSLKKGNSFAQAQGEALEASLGHPYAAIFQEPNNTLAVHYLRSIMQNDLPLLAHTIKRLGSYHDTAASEDLLSASAIRRLVIAGHAPCGMPEYALAILREQIAAKHGPVSWHDLAPLLFYRFRLLKKEAADYPEAGEGLGERLWQAARITNNWDELMEISKTRRFPQTRIQRVLTYVLLDISRTRLALIDIERTPPYLRVLGLNAASTPIRDLLKHSQLPVVYAAATAPKKAARRLQRCLELDIQATDVHTLSWQKDSRAGLDFVHPIVIR